MYGELEKSNYNSIESFFWILRKNFSVESESGPSKTSVVFLTSIFAYFGQFFTISALISDMCFLRLRKFAFFSSDYESARKSVMKSGITCPIPKIFIFGHLRLKRHWDLRMHHQVNIPFCLKTHDI